METWERDLVELFSRNPRGGITTAQLAPTAAALMVPLDLVERDLRYQAVTNCIDECRLFAERILASGEATEQQRRACLVELKRRRRTRDDRPDAADIQHIVNTFVCFPRWSDVEQQKYGRVAAMILGWRDYFISYTRRGVPTVNAEFKALLKAHLGRNVKEGELTTGNLVAKMIHDRLVGLGLSGYFDESALRDGDALAVEIRHLLQETFVLVQLLEPANVIPPSDGRLNWSYEEFIRFQEAIAGLPVSLTRGTRHTFLIGGSSLDDILPPEPDAGYQAKWFVNVEGAEGEIWRALSTIPPRPDAVRRWFQARAKAIVDRRNELIQLAIDA